MLVALNKYFRRALFNMLFFPTLLQLNNCLFFSHLTRRHECQLTPSEALMYLHYIGAMISDYTSLYLLAHLAYTYILYMYVLDIHAYLPEWNSKLLNKLIRLVCLSVQWTFSSRRCSFMTSSMLRLSIPALRAIAVASCVVSGASPNFRSDRNGNTMESLI